ncbi:hypothetical protein PR003_g6453 [Phytophthora rubi]|uniref:Uncharacterized protein n=1 Tax=Phytophthora rubi TaxID=129364 RepID=A0A6A3N1L5_9STRA|nr:hypothetical protein PR002_g6512 [Phytophthora rubi]KAE9348379.1 hypothetical protein PR003_g6453 [Phytophthora rubi]
MEVSGPPDLASRSPPALLPSLFLGQRLLARGRSLAPPSGLVQRPPSPPSAPLPLHCSPWLDQVVTPSVRSASGPALSFAVSSSIRSLSTRSAITPSELLGTAHRVA